MKSRVDYTCQGKYYRKIGQQNQVSLGKFDAGSILNSQYNQSLLYIHMRRVTFRVDI